MKDRKLATRYARALLAAIPDADAAARADEFLAALRDVIRSSPEVRDLVHDPSVPRTARRAVLCQLADAHGMPRQVHNFIATVVDHRRATSLPSIADVFHEEREARAGVVPAEITTASPLSEELKQRTLETLERATGRKVRLETRVDPALLGGAVTRMGSRVHDGSLRTQLRQLRNKMIQE